VGDGFHPLCSAMVFADFGDLVSIGSEPGLSVSGPFAPDLEGGGENLVSKAMFALVGHLPNSVGLHLEKRLPVAAGLGGGSSDAGATLRLLRAVFAPQITDDDLEKIAAGLGSDGAACLRARPVLAQGRGERLSPLPKLPELYGVMVNPRIGVSTADVYRRFDEMAGFGEVSPPDLPQDFQSPEALTAWLKTTRNDLQTPAISIAPVITTVLSALERSPGVLFARMSGSGATCFALCRNREASIGVAEALTQSHPTWWVQACRMA